MGLSEIPSNRRAHDGPVAAARAGGLPVVARQRQEDLQKGQSSDS